MFKDLFKDLFKDIFNDTFKDTFFVYGVLFHFDKVMLSTFAAAKHCVIFTHARITRGGRVLNSIFFKITEIKL